MKITGLITEYNPLHNGHIYHITKSKQITDADAIICVMSGNFVQRGIPAIIDKWERTKLALLAGVDLVIELPAIYALSSAEFFAFGSVSLLNSLGIVDNICFGSECNDIGLLYKIAEILAKEPEKYRLLLKEHLSRGKAYPKARSLSLIEYLKNEDINYGNEELETILNSSNNILGIEYVKSLINLNSRIKAFTIKRVGAEYNSNELKDTFSSATSIRNYLEKSNDLSVLEKQVPEFCFNELKDLIKNGYDFAFSSKMMPFLKYKAFYVPEQIKNLPDVSEGLESKIIKSIVEAKSFDDIIDLSKSKRYAYTRISRILCQYFAGFERYETKSLRRCPAPYSRILGFNEKGKYILKMAKIDSEIPEIIKIPKMQTDVLKIDMKCTEMYSLLNKNIDPKADYYISPQML